jgi:hypothetical protein
MPEDSRLHKRLRENIKCHFMDPSFCWEPLSHWADEKITVFMQMQSSPATRHGRAWGERRYSSHSFLTSALDGGEWLASRPGRALPPGKGHPVHIVQEPG